MFVRISIFENKHLYDEPNLYTTLFIIIIIIIIIIIYLFIYLFT